MMRRQNSGLERGGVRGVMRNAWVVLLGFTALYIVFAQSHAQRLAVQLEARWTRQTPTPAGGMRANFLLLRQHQEESVPSLPPRPSGGIVDPRVLSVDEVEDIRIKFREQVGDKRYQNCSVVGNDSSMRKSRYGQFIDAAQAVYRMNFAPLRDFKQDVGLSTHTMCLNPEKMRKHLKANPGFKTDAGGAPRVLVVGDVRGSDVEAGQKAGPCVERSPGGLCIKRVDNERVEAMYPVVQQMTEELLATMQSGVGEEDGVPTTGLYCLVLALAECDTVDVYGIGAGTIQKTDLTDLEYFKDEQFRGWDARHNAEAERTLLRVLASQVWKSILTESLGKIRWHNPLSDDSMMNKNLVDARPCTSGIRC